MTITLDWIKKQIKKTEFTKMGEKTTICVITLNNNFEVVGSSACVDKNTYNQIIGENLAYDKAIEKIWELEGYLMQCKLHVEY